jgi:hypothetical protein
MNHFFEDFNSIDALKFEVGFGETSNQATANPYQTFRKFSASRYNLQGLFNGLLLLTDYQVQIWVGFHQTWVWCEFRYFFK